MRNSTVTRQFHFSVGNKGKKKISMGPEPEDVSSTGRVPRIARLMALAIHFDDMITSGRVLDQAQIARLGHVSRARVTQIMNLLHLAPDIQQQILFLPEITAGRDPMTERDVRPIAREYDWQIQRRMWSRLAGTCTPARQNPA